MHGLLERRSHLLSSFIPPSPPHSFMLSTLQPEPRLEKLSGSGEDNKGHLGVDPGGNLFSGFPNLLLGR